MKSLFLDPEKAWQAWSPTPEQPWDIRRAAHLMRRAEFGKPLRELLQDVQRGYSATIDRLFSMETSPAFDQSLQPMEKSLSSSQNPKQLAAWWLLRMLQTPCQLLEKTTLFWHGHFATSAEKVANARAMLRQIELLRSHALGGFEPMVQGIARDVAMLIYLDSQENRKTRPNENFARELMELFCLGPGNYSERDIKELARCFTGWEIRRGKFRFNANQHDTGEKKLLGEKGAWGGEKAVGIIVRQSATSRLIARKLVRFFVCDEAKLTDELLEPVSCRLRETDFDLKSVIRMILTSRLFYSEETIGRKIKSPVELSVGLLRGLGAQDDLNRLADRLFGLGHLPLYPPNVKGWGGGRQWVNASTYLGRSNLVSAIAHQPDERFAGGSISKALSIKTQSDPGQWVQKLLDHWMAVPVQIETQEQLVRIASAANRNINQRVADVVSAIGATPEFQLN